MKFSSSHSYSQETESNRRSFIQRAVDTTVNEKEIPFISGRRIDIQPKLTIGSIIGPVLGWEQRRRELDCLRSLFDEMNQQTWWFLRRACRDGNYITSLSGVRYIPEDRADAFGHCWIACQGTKICGEEPTRFFGERYETFREAMKYLSFSVWGHNSYEEDTFNQTHGRELARNNLDGDCSSLCYQAVVSGELRFHGGDSGEDPRGRRVYNCSDITINGHLYRQGWRTIPFEYLERF